MRTADDPTVHGARLFPAGLGETHGWGVEPGGGVRAIVAGIRVVSMADGSMSVAPDRLPATPSSVVALPERLGGGFLFVVGAHVWRSEEWLGRSTAFFTWSAPVALVNVGLDRVYLRSPQGAIAALDARAGVDAGVQVGLGPLPASPSIGHVAALDAWRAVAVADLRGALLTVDAGSTWRPLALPIEPSDVVSLGDSIAVGGFDQGRQARGATGNALDGRGTEEWWEVRFDGQASRLPSGVRPGDAATGAAGAMGRTGAAGAPADALLVAGSSTPGRAPEGAVRAFGARPLASAIEDGWPLADGTALVARDGALARVRWSDGALVESVADAFPLKPARCHALALGFDRRAASGAARPMEGAPRDEDGAGPVRAGDPGALGFVCGEPRGRTVIYRWDPPTAALVEIRRFDQPREVLGFGNGALAVRGPCAPDSPADATVVATAGPTSADRPLAEDPASAEQAWCVAPPDASWRETRVPGGSRIVVLTDGRIARVTPPRGGDLSTARLVLSEVLSKVLSDAQGKTEGKTEHTSEQAIAFASQRPLEADVARALRFGVWMDGFEERRPGVVGGWIDAAGSLVGIEIAADGQARVGEYIRDAGAPIASGRWAFGWTASRRGFETTDGGMTWTKEIALPDVLASGRAVPERACGPVGCIAGGWLRVGWGTPDQALAPEPRPRASSAGHAPPALDLDCTPAGGAPPPLPQPATGAEANGGAAGARGGQARAALAGLYAGSTWGAVSELPPFSTRTGPAMPSDDLGLSVEALGGVEQRQRVPLGRIYAWGPSTGDWDPLGRWQVRWQWRWGGWQDLRSSSVGAAPWTSLDVARRALGMAPGVSTAWTIVDPDDADHALLLARRTAGPTTVEILELEAERPIVAARRPGGEPFAEVESVTRMGGRWYVATTQSPGESAATVLWSLDGAAASEIARVPRVGFEVRPALRLARHTHGRAVGLTVEGQPDELRGVVPRWVAAVDVESGTVATPEPLAPIDLSDRTVSLCTGDDAGWELDVAYPGPVRLRVGVGAGVGARWEATLQGAVARMRLSRDRACVERVLGSVDTYGASAPGALVALAEASYNSAPRAHEAARTIPASVLSARSRYALRCAER